MEKNIEICYDKYTEKGSNILTHIKEQLVKNDSGDTMLIAVCDDEQVCRDLLLYYIKNCIALYNYSGIIIEDFSCGEELVNAYNSGKRYDLIFLDIKMKKLNGFSTAKSIRDLDNDSTIIFVTSLTEYIFNSFEYRPFWFIIKPISEEKFRHIFNKAIAEIKNVKMKEYSFYTRENGLLSIQVNKILYIESFLRRIIIHTPNQQFTNYATIRAEEDKLKKYNFVRIHNGYLVNMAYIQRINKYSVILKNNVELPLSEHRFKAVFDSFTSYLARCSV